VSVDALRAYVEELLAVYRFPGLCVAVTDRDRLIASEAFGHANLDAGIPVGRDTYFEFGSIGKVFTALLVLQLREEGLIELDEPLASYLPWFEVRSEHEPITIRHVLTHSSGLMVGADLSSNSRYDVWALRKSDVGFPPGSRYFYSNIAYQAVGFVVEELTGTRYSEALRIRILDPLGLRAVDPQITNEGRHRLAVAYERRYDDRPARRTDPWVPAPWLETGTGDGSQAGTMEDLSAFLRVLLNDGEGIIGAESFELMTTPAIEADDGWWYGCGLELHEHEGRREIRHGGSMPGFGSTMLGDLDSGLGVAVAVNGPDERGFTEGLAEAVLELYRGNALPPVPDPLAVADAADYSGVFEGDAGRLAITADGDRLLLDGRPLEPRGGDRFLADRDDLARYLLRFAREDDRLDEVAHGGDVYRREGLPEVPPATAPEEWRAYPGHYRAYNPWYSNFRIVLRRGDLILIFAWGLELTLEPLPDGSFRVDDEWSPERMRFDAIVDGQALRADFSGEAYYRML
jgi:D-alanyl-D-alanine carboxypeptidase